MTKVLDAGVLRDATPDEIAEIEVRQVVALPAAALAAVAKTYRDVDGIHEAAVGSRATEYADAEIAARAFVAAGYAGTVSDYVAGFALNNPTGIAQTNQWAADQIIARADAFHAAKLALRSQRFARQAEMRAATTDEELATAVSAWDGFIATVRAQLGL